MFGLIHEQFQPAVPSWVSTANGYGRERICVNTCGEVGLQYQIEDNLLIGFQFLIPLQHFQDPKRRSFTSTLSRLEVFGHVVYQKVSGTITKLSHYKKADRMNYSITMESKW